VLILNDASSDGTQEWIQTQNDPNLVTYHNPGPERIGIVGMFDKGIQMARTEVIMAFHADMVVCPDFDKNILKYLQKGVVVSATRVEPPLHPEGPEKITRNYGIEPDEFNFDVWYQQSDKLKQDKATEGIFAPWCMYKEDFLAVGGHDELFAPQSKEDSDLFNRFVLSGYKVLQSWNALVYHFTSRGSRFNKHAGGAAGKNSEEWLYTTNKNMRNFIRKWGTPVMHDRLMKPTVYPKYDIGIKVTGCNSELLELLEPWCSTILIDDEMQALTLNYLDKEQPNTKIDLSEKIKTTPFDKLKNEVIIGIDRATFKEGDFQILQQLPLILQMNGKPGKFMLGTMTLKIKALTEYQNTLINL
jgi:GT2 family glycosyltransferase